MLLFFEKTFGKELRISGMYTKIDSGKVLKYRWIQANCRISLFLQSEKFVMNCVMKSRTAWKINLDLSLYLFRVYIHNVLCGKGAP